MAKNDRLTKEYELEVKIKGIFSTNVPVTAATPEQAEELLRENPFEHLDLQEICEIGIEVVAAHTND